MNDFTPTQDSVQQPVPRKQLSIVLTILFVLSMIMGTGPGVLLVNRPETIVGIPLVYAWGILWYLVQVAVALVAYFAIWRNSADDIADASPSDSTRGGQS